MNWNELANTKVADVERPPQAPIGHYIATFAGKQAECDESKQKGTPFAKFPIVVREALEDVDAEELEKFNQTTQFPVNASVTFYFTPQSNWRFTEFAQGMGVSGDLNIPESIAELANSQEPFVVEAKLNRNDANPDDPGFVRFENPIPLSAWQERAQRAAA